MTLSSSLTSGGRPAAGLLVLAQPAGELYPAPWQPATVRSLSDAAGRATLPAGLPCDVLVASAEGPLWRGRLVLEPGTAQKLELPAPRRFAVLAVDPAGRPVAGVRVAVDGLLLEAATGESGRLAFAAAAAPALRLLAADGRWASRGADPSPGAAELRAVLQPPQRLALKVLDRQSGLPIAGALVWPGAHPEILARSGPGGEGELVVPWGGATAL